MYIYSLFTIQQHYKNDTLPLVAWLTLLVVNTVIIRGACGKIEYDTIDQVMSYTSRHVSQLVRNASFVIWTCRKVGSKYKCTDCGYTFLFTFDCHTRMPLYFIALLYRFGCIRIEGGEVCHSKCIHVIWYFNIATTYASRHYKIIRFIIRIYILVRAIAMTKNTTSYECLSYCLVTL